MYSLRRTAIIEARRRRGTDFAEELADHAVGGSSIHVDDNWRLSDVDMVNERLGVEAMPRDELRKMFAKSRELRWRPEDALPNAFPGADMGTYDREQSMGDARVHDEYLEAEHVSVEVFNKARHHLTPMDVNALYLVTNTEILDKLEDKNDGDAASITDASSGSIHAMSDGNRRC